MLYKSIIISTLITFILSISLNAQDPLSLADAIRRGLEANYDIQIEAANVKIDQNNNTWGEAGRYPEVTLGATFNNSVTNVNQGEQFFSGQTFPGYELNNQKSGSLSPTVNANWTLFQGNSINITKSRLARLEAESEGNADIVVANTVQLIVLSYYKVVLEKERLQVFGDQLSLSRDKWRYVKLQSDIGSAVSSDLLLEETNYLDDSVNFINQQLNYRNALRSLNFVLSELNVDRDYTFTNELTDELEAVDYDALINEVEKSNIDLRKQYITQAILEDDNRLAKSDRYPSLALDAGYGYNRAVQNLTDARSPADYTPPEDVSITQRTNWYANLTLSFTLFNGGRINRAIRNTLIKEDIGTIQLEQLRASVYRDLADSYDEYSIRQQLFAINDRKEEAAQLNLDISGEKYRNGTVNSFDFRTVQNNRLAASITRLQSLYDIIDSKVALMRLSGNLLNTFVAE